MYVSVHSSLGIHILDGTKTRLLHWPLGSGHHRVPVRALHLPGSHVADVAAEQEAAAARPVLLRCAGRGLVTG